MRANKSRYRNAATDDAAIRLQQCPVVGVSRCTQSDCLKQRMYTIKPVVSSVVNGVNGVLKVSAVVNEPRDVLCHG